MHTTSQLSLLHKTLHILLLLAIFLFSAGSLAFAHAQGETPLFAAIDSLDVLNVPQVAMRTRAVSVNLSVLTGPQGDVGSKSLEGNTIQMNLFDDTVYDVVIDSMEVSALGGTAWNGHIQGKSPSYAYLVYTDGVFAAHVASLEGVYEVQYSAEDMYTISQLDQSLYPEDIVLEPVLPDDALPAVKLDPNAKTITYIDVMVVYTARAATAVGGISAMNAKVDLAVQETNQSYINSNVNQRVNLVYQGQIIYDEGTNPDFGTTLDYLTGKADGQMDNVHALRDTYSADLVSLFIEGTQYCGIAWLMSSPSVSFEADGFSVVAQSCATGYYSFAHEMGHNMGSRHDTYVDSNNTPYPYSHGFTYPASSWRTIMAYNNACTAVGKNCTRLQYWSNPSVNYGGVAMGNANSADNHTSLNNTAATVAAFRTSNGFSKSSPPNGATNQPVTNLSLSWGTNPGTTQYEVCYDTSNDNVCNSSWQNKGTSTSTTITGLSNGATYYWQVRALNGSSYTYANAETWWSFTTVTATLPGAFSKLEPASGATNQSMTPTLLWEQSTGADSYAYCYDTSNNNNCDSSWISTGTATADTLSGLSPNTTYYWQARATNNIGTTYANSNVWWSFTTLAPANNDDFLGATSISTLPYNNPGTQNTVSATSDTTDPEFPCGAGGKKSNTVWFKYTPGATPFYVDTSGSDYDTVLAVWTGSEGSLVNVACNDDYTGLQSQVTVSGAIGTTYYIEVASFNPDAAGWLDLHVTTAVPAPGNDDFASAVLLDLPYLDWMNVEGATTDTTDPVLPCAPYTKGYNSVWFRYTPASSGEVALSTYNSGYDTVLAVWSGTEGNLTNIACNDDGRFPASLLTLNLNAGSTYYIEVVKFDTATPNDYWLYLNLIHVGDDFDVPFILNPSLPTTTVLNTVNYSRFFDDPDFTDCNVIGMNSVWYRYVPSESGMLNVNTAGSSYDTILGVWTGDRGALTSLGCNDDGAGNFLSDISVPVSAGNMYYIEVASWWGYLDGDAVRGGKSPHRGSLDSGKHLRDAEIKSGGTLILNLSWHGVKAYVGGALRGNYYMPSGSSTRQSYTGLNNGPVQIINPNGGPILAAERVIYKINGVNTSFSEMMGLPDAQLDSTYWLPWYNNVDLDTQLRFANVSGTTATVHVYIGSTEMIGSPFTLYAGESTRKSFAGVNKGPVRIVSDVDIVAAERVIYKDAGGVNTSFSELMALPNGQLDTTYWFPWYNNVDLDTQLRFANVSSSPATVHVFIGGTEVTPLGGITLAVGASTRQSFAGINDGPVQIVSDQNIVAAERVIYRAAGGVNTSFTETMGLPDAQLDTTYWLPWYNNVDLDTQLRFANVSNTTATVHVYIGGQDMGGFTLAPGASTRQSFARMNNGPVKIESNVPIVAAERVIYKVNGVNTSFSEMMGLPNHLLDVGYWLPWYNNVDLDTQLRFGVP